MVVQIDRRDVCEAVGSHSSAEGAEAAALSRERKGSPERGAGNKVELCHNGTIPSFSLGSSIENTAKNEPYSFSVAEPDSDWGQKQRIPRPVRPSTGKPVVSQWVASGRLNTSSIKPTAGHPLAYHWLIIGGSDRSWNSLLLAPIRVRFGHRERVWLILSGISDRGAKGR